MQAGFFLFWHRCEFKHFPRKGPYLKKSQERSCLQTRGKLFKCCSLHYYIKRPSKYVKFHNLKSWFLSATAKSLKMMLYVFCSNNSKVTRLLIRKCMGKCDWIVDIVDMLIPSILYIYQSVKTTCHKPMFLLNIPVRNKSAELTSPGSWTKSLFKQHTTPCAGKQSHGLCLTNCSYMAYVLPTVKILI